MGVAERIDEGRLHESYVDGGAEYASISFRLGERPGITMSEVYGVFHASWEAYWGFHANPSSLHCSNSATI